LRVTGFVHNLVNVLLLLGIPISAIGLIALPWTATGKAFGLRLPAISLPSRSPRSAGQSAEPPPPAVIVRAVPPRPVASAGPQPRPPSVSEWPAIDLGIAHQADRPPAWMARPERLEPIVPVRTAPGALAMLLAFSGLTFAATSLLFPVATTWGTFLHASAAVQVLLLVSALLALDRLIAETGRRRGWTRPVAFLGPVLGVAAGALFTVALLPGFGRDGEGVRARFEALPAALAAAGVPIEVRGAPVITDFPIYLAEVTGANALALPDEPPDSVIDLAAHFPGTRLLIVSKDNEGIWPEAALSTARGIACFESVPVAIDEFEVYRILCP
jgi:energy-converting hydrogenase Eha subunit A